MGGTRVRLKVYGADGKALELEALVDTGATFTKVPNSIASALRLKAAYETEVELADGRRINRVLALAEVELEGVRRPVLVAIGEEGERPLIGYTTLENLGFKVNPLTGELERTAAIEYVAAVSWVEAATNARRGGEMDGNGQKLCIRGEISPEACVGLASGGGRDHWLGGIP